MDQILNKVGSYWIGKRANKELNSVGDDINVCPFFSFCFNLNYFRFCYDLIWKFLIMSVEPVNFIGLIA